MRTKLNSKLLSEIHKELENHSDNGIPPFCLTSLAGVIAEKLGCTHSAVLRAIPSYLNKCC